MWGHTPPKGDPGAPRMGRGYYIYFPAENYKKYPPAKVTHTPFFLGKVIQKLICTYALPIVAGIYMRNARSSHVWWEGRTFRSARQASA